MASNLWKDAQFGNYCCLIGKKSLPWATFAIYYETLLLWDFMYGTLSCKLEGKVSVRGQYSNVGTLTVVIKVIPGGGILAC